MGAMTRPEDQPEPIDPAHEPGPEPGRHPGEAPAAGAGNPPAGDAPDAPEPGTGTRDWRTRNTAVEWGAAPEEQPEHGAEADSTAPAKPRKSWKAIPTEAWVWLAAALLLVGGLGFIAGDRMGPSGGGTVNLAGATPGSNFDGPVTMDNGTYDAGILGPRAGTTVATAEDLPNMHRRSEADPFALGALDAPVVMTMFSDFECPFCARHALTTQQNLIDDYVDSGLLRIEWNDMPMSSPRSARVAEAGRAAAAQGKFWEFEQAAFTAAQDKGTGHPEFTDEELVEIARTAGVGDMDLFERQLDEGTWENAVNDAVGYGRAIGVEATPMFLIGGQMASGAQPEQVFRDYIELELMKAQRNEG